MSLYSGAPGERRFVKILVPLAALMAMAALAQAQAPTAGSCTVFPADNIWNTRIDQLPAHPSSSTWVTTIGASKPLHPDFGSGTYDGGPIGIPFVLVPGTQTKYPASFQYQDESDTGPYAIPLSAPIEGGSASTGDRHAIAVDVDHCVLYEIYDAHSQTASWQGGSGAIFNLLSDAPLRPATWTSADAAGLPIFPGLVRYDEIVAGEIRHAIRFTVPQTQKAYVWPARHYASSQTSAQYPPMGARFRLKASFDISHFSATNQIILTAMKRYGMMLADNGSSWYISGAPDDRWNNDDLHALTTILGSNFEAVDVSPLMVDPNSGQAGQTSVSVAVTPSAASVQVNAQRQFTATVTGNSNQAVTWDVNGSIGGNSAVGFIDSISGFYTAPSVAPAPATVTVHATSKAMPSAVGSASVTVTNPTPPVSVSVSPASASVQVGHGMQFAATVQNATVTTVAWMVNGIAGGNSGVGTISTSGFYTAPSAMPSPANVLVQASSTAAPSAVGSASVTVTSPPPPVSVAVSPSGTSVQVGHGMQFTATVQNSAVTTVTWMVNGVTGGNSAVGTISSSGFYTAPSAMPSPANVLVQASSTVAPSAVGSASVNITSPPPPVSVSVSPVSASVQVGHGMQFAATVQNATVTTVTWMVNGIPGGNSAVGTISASGFFTAPSATPSPAAVTVQASSTVAPSAVGSASVTITSPPPVSVTISPSSASVRIGHTHQFTASVQNAAVTTVFWKVNGIAGGNSTVGTISSNGLYTAPNTKPSPSQVTVSAVSAADPTKSASASVSITSNLRR